MEEKETNWIALKAASDKYGINSQWLWDLAKTRGVPVKTDFQKGTKRKRRFLDADALDQLMIARKEWKKTYGTKTSGELKQTT